MKSKWFLIACCLLSTGWMCNCENSRANNLKESDNTATASTKTNVPLMSGRSTFLLKGNVEKVIYGDGRCIYFNEDGNVLKQNVRENAKGKKDFEYIYSNPTRFIIKGDESTRYKIVFDDNTRKEIWDNPEALGLTYTYDPNGRLISVNEPDYGLSRSETYTYEATNTFPSKEVVRYDSDDGEVITEMSIFSNYSFDNQGNWISRNVNYKKVIESEDNKPETTTKVYSEKRIISYMPSLQTIPEGGGFNTELFNIHSHVKGANLADIINLHLNFDTVIILTLLLLPLSILLHIIRKNRDDYEGFEGVQITAFTIFFIAVCVLELIIAMSGINPLWFCNPSKIGWFLSVIGFFVFIYILNNQVKSFIVLMKDITNAGDYTFGQSGVSTKKYLTGILSGSIGFVILCAFELLLFGQQNITLKIYFWIIAGIVAALQIFQAVIIYNEMTKNENYYKLKETKRAMRNFTIWKYFISFVYLIGVSALFVTLMHFMSLLLFAVAVLFVFLVLFIMGQVQKSNKGGSPSSSSSSDTIETLSYAYCRNCKYYPGVGCNCNHKGRRILNDDTKACTLWERDD